MEDCDECEKFLVNYGIEVRARSMDEAQEKANKMIANEIDYPNSEVPALASASKFDALKRLFTHSEVRRLR